MLQMSGVAVTILQLWDSALDLNIKAQFCCLWDMLIACLVMCGKFNKEAQNDLDPA